MTVLTINKVTDSPWFKEWITPDEAHIHRVKKYVVRTQTAFQNAAIADLPAFGRCLILDGEMQSAQSDEFIYHEALVHPALLLHPQPKKVLILGGGEGATAREILKHRSVQSVVMVDIDGDVIDFCKKHLPTWHQGCFDNPRLRVVVDDAKKFIETTREKFDVIISDLPSPSEAGPAVPLYTLEFYRDAIKKLNKGGIFVTQAASGHPLQLDCHLVLYSTLKKVFRSVHPYYCYVPSFDVPWGFIVASDRRNPLAMTAAQTDRILKKRTRGPLSFYDGTTHVGLFHVPLFLRRLLQAEKRVITKQNPIYFYKQS